MDIIILQSKISKHFAYLCYRIEKFFLKSTLLLRIYICVCAHIYKYIWKTGSVIIGILITLLIISILFVINFIIFLTINGNKVCQF